MRALPLVLVVVLVASAGQLPAQKTLNVPAQYKTIQAAIDAAQNQDTVLVAPGTYPEYIDFKGKGITVKSSGGASVTTIRSDGKNPAVSFVTNETPDSIIQGFTITNGKGSPGSGIRCVGASPTIRENVITGNSAKKGGGIFCTTSSALIEKNTITKNTAWGGGICAESSSPTISANLITGNAGAGIVCDVSGSPFIVGNTVSNNNSGFNGGAGMRLRSCTPIVVNNMIHGNIGAHGGGINCSSATATITNNTLTNNSSSGYGGDGIRLYGSSNVVVVNCIVWETGKAGAILVQGGTISVTYSDVAGGFIGTGNLDADPIFIDPGLHDFHLQITSPCKDKGTNAAPQIPTRDFDGDPRILNGIVDIGADEITFSRLSLSGIPTPGGSIALHMHGKPYDVVILGISFVPIPINPPVAIPGYGDFYLYWPFALIPLGAIPPQGTLKFPMTFPKTFPVPRDFPVQALIGQELSNHVVVKVR